MSKFENKGTIKYKIKYKGLVAMIIYLYFAKSYIL